MTEPIQPIPEIPAEMKAPLKKDRLAQYQARIYNLQMDIAAYTAVGDTVRLERTEKDLNDFLLSYYAVEAM